MKLFDQRADKLALRLFTLINADKKLRSKLTGNTGARGLCGPGADEMFAQWKKEQGRPEATVEEFLQWFKDAIKVVPPKSTTE